MGLNKFFQRVNKHAHARAFLVLNGTCPGFGINHIRTISEQKSLSRAYLLALPAGTWKRGKPLIQFLPFIFLFSLQFSQGPEKVVGGGGNFLIFHFLYVNLRQIFAATKSGGPGPPNPLDATCTCRLWSNLAYTSPTGCL